MLPKVSLYKNATSNIFAQGFHNEEVKKMTYQPLGKTGKVVSCLALGTGGFSNFFGEFHLDEGKETVLQGLQAGINYINTLPFYGMGESETVLGQLIKSMDVVNAAVVGLGLLTLGGPQKWHSAPHSLKEACRQASEYCKENGVDIAKLALCFAFDNYGDTVVNGMDNPTVLKSSLNSVQEGLNAKGKQIQAAV